MTRLSILVRNSYIVAFIYISVVITNKKITISSRHLQDNRYGTDAQPNYEGLSGLRAIVTGLEHSGNAVIGTLLNNAPCVMGALETGYLLAETPADIENVQPWFNWHLKLEKQNTPHNYMLSLDDINAMKSALDFPEMLDILRKRSHIFNDLNEEPYCPSPTQMIDNTPRYVHPQFFDNILAKTPGVPMIITKKTFEDQKKSVEERGMSISREHYDAIYNNVYRMMEKHPNRIKIIDFDEFMYAPNAVMEDVFQFLDLEWDPEYLNMSGIIKKWKDHPEQVNWYEDRKFHHEDIQNFPGQQTTMTNEWDTIYGAWKEKWENAHLLPTNLHTGIKFTPDVPKFVQSWGEYWSPLKEETNEELLWSRFMNIGDLFDQFPTPVSKDTMQIYNEKAYHELIQLLTESQGSIKILANGGSPTAGAKLMTLHLRYYTIFAKYIHELNLNVAGATLETIDRAHGGRGSLDSAVFSPNFIPPNTDIVLWEFAINDHFQFMHNPLQMRSVFIAWLHEIEKISPRPPKVIIVYLWAFKFEWDEITQKTLQPVYEAHAHLAKEFDFVVGFINTASYLDELGMGLDDSRAAFLADVHHPNETGHLLIAFLLLNLLRGEGIWNDESKISEEITERNGVEEFQWYCDTVEKSLGWRSPLGAATLFFAKQ